MKKLTKPLTEEERQARIDFLIAEFYLTFRVYDEDEEKTETEFDNASEYEFTYDDIDCFCNVDKSDVEEFEADFAAVDALDVFYPRYYTYCQEQLAVLRTKIDKYVVADLVVDKKNDCGLKKIEKLRKLQLQRIEDNHRAQQDYEAEIVATKNKMLALGILLPAEKDVQEKPIEKHKKKKHNKATVKSKRKKKSKLIIKCKQKKKSKLIVKSGSKKEKLDSIANVL